MLIWHIWMLTWQSQYNLLCFKLGIGKGLGWHAIFLSWVLITLCMPPYFKYCCFNDMSIWKWLKITNFSFSFSSTIGIFNHFFLLKDCLYVFRDRPWCMRYGEGSSCTCQPWIMVCICFSLYPMEMPGTHDSSTFGILFYTIFIFSDQKNLD